MSEINPISTKQKTIFNKMLVIADSSTNPVLIKFENEKEIDSLIGVLFQLKANF